jgi:hypothetical protein
MVGISTLLLKFSAGGPSPFGEDADVPHGNKIMLGRGADAVNLKLLRFLPFGGAEITAAAVPHL